MKTQLVMIYIFTASVAVMAWGRTTTQDPMAEKYSGLSPYLWCAGNPVRYTDPTGRIVEYDMTDKELDNFSDMLNKLRISQAFDKFFSELENNPDITTACGR